MTTNLWGDPAFTTSTASAIVVMREIGKIQFEQQALEWFERQAPAVRAELVKRGVKFPKEKAMGKAGMIFKEVRFVIEDELTQCYVAIQATGDAPLGVQGWHHKTFPASKSILDIVGEFVTKDGDPVLWPLNAPPRP